MYAQQIPVSQATEIEREAFYKKTYLHVAFAVLAFIVVETLLIATVPVELVSMMVGSPYSWLFILGIFWLASMLSNKLVMAEKKSTQYMGLGIFVFIEAIIFLPMIYMAIGVSGSSNVLMQAGFMTLAMFAGLSFIAFTTKKDLSWMRGILVMGGFIALGLIVLGAIFGFELGLWFSVGMVAIASGSILYQTQQIKNEYSSDMYVGAALQLFASVMLLFWYILRIFLSRD